MSDLTQLVAHPGRATVPFVDAAGNADRPLALWSYRPAAWTPDWRLVLVQHGMGRNAGDYRDFWVELAERYHLLIVATEFSAEHYPGPESYNNGLVLDADGAVRPAGRWTYAVPGRVFAALRAAGIVTRPTASLFGHSAGGQFGHRLLATQPHDFLDAVAIGNPGWYTLPTLALPFPEGLGGIGVTEAQIDAMLAYPLTILAGDADTQTSGDDLPQGEGAMRQGVHRYARANHFVGFARATALARGVPFNWRLVSVPGVGHAGDVMSIAAATLWFDGAVTIPEDRKTGAKTL